LSGIRFFSSNQSPRSIMRQRSLQKGRDSGRLSQLKGFLQVGQVTVLSLMLMAREYSS